MRNAVVDYAIRRSNLADAKGRDHRFNSTEAVAELVERAKRSFTDLANTGEGGEMLLFLLAERFLEVATNSLQDGSLRRTRECTITARMEVCRVTPEGVLKLYWGESKIYGDASAAIRACLNSSPLPDRTRTRGGRAGARPDALERQGRP